MIEWGQTLLGPSVHLLHTEEALELKIFMPRIPPIREIRQMRGRVLWWKDRSLEIDTTV